MERIKTNGKVLIKKTVSKKNLEVGWSCLSHIEKAVDLNYQLVKTFDRPWRGSNWHKI